MEVSGQFHALATLYPGKKKPHTHQTGGLVGSRAGLDVSQQIETSCLSLGLNPRSSSS